MIPKTNWVDTFLADPIVSGKYICSALFFFSVLDIWKSMSNGCEMIPKMNWVDTFLAYPIVSGKYFLFPFFLFCPWFLKEQEQWVRNDSEDELGGYISRRPNCEWEIFCVSFFPFPPAHPRYCKSMKSEWDVVYWVDALLADSFNCEWKLNWISFCSFFFSMRLIFERVWELDGEWRRQYINVLSWPFLTYFSYSFKHQGQKRKSGKDKDFVICSQLKESASFVH